jgi:signal transduction histidine kinase/DNA-binding NarL/FixJ family response regulator
MTDRTAAILVVDDRPEQRLSLAAVLREVCDEVIAVSSGREALRQLLKRDFAVVLLDINMPEMDGFETASLIRQRTSSEHTPIIFVTAYGDDRDATRGYSLGAVDFILSPVDPYVLKAKVSVFLELYRKTVEANRHAEELRRHASQLRRLADAAAAFHAARSLEELLKGVADTAASIVGAQQVAVSIDAAASEAAHGRSRCVVVRPERTALQRLTRYALADAPARSVRMTRAELDGRAFAGELDRADDAPPLRGWLAAPLANRGGRPMGWVQLSDKREGDFTAEDEMLLLQLARMAAIAAENTLFSEAQEANRVKDQFLATLSHELRTPLQAILSWSQMLRESGHDEQPTLVRGLEVIERNARAQTRLIEDLLDVSRIISGKLVLKECPLSLGDLLRDAVENAQPAARDRHIEIRADRIEDVQVRGDSDRLRQVMANLFSNAIKFTPEGGHVDLSLEVDGADAVVRMRDTGRGVAKEFLPHLFERFRQADGGTTRSHGGLGIGLAIVRQLVEMHRGIVHAESDGEGFGTTFVVRLPAGDVDMLEAPIIDRPAEEDDPPPDLSGLCVLLVEDDVDTRECLSLGLQQHGARVVAAATVGDALAAFDREPAHVLVSDLAMPGEDGFALIRSVRERTVDRGGRVPAAALSAHVRAEDRARAVLAGFDVHVAKPVAPAQLARAVRDLAWRSHG